MIRFINLDKVLSEVEPVTTSEIFLRAGGFNDYGLFSENIFGPLGSLDRRNKISYINLNSKVIHPTALKILYRLDRKIEKFISTESNFLLDKNNQLIEDKNGVTGMIEFIKLLPKIEFRSDSKDREKFIKLIKTSFKDNILIIDKVPIIPPDFRDIYQDKDGQWIQDPLNDYYLTIIRRSLQMKSVGKSGALFDLLNYSIQDAVVEYDKFIKTKVQKKRGLIRQQLLGKRIDYSGRAVIVPNPKLKINEMGVPFKMAVSLFEPFIEFQLLRTGITNKEELKKEIKSFTNLDLSIESLKLAFKAIKKGEFIPETLYNLIYEATERAIKDRVITAKRDPVLQAESYRGYKVVLTKGNTLEINNMQVGGHNADFDGDTMAVFHPLSEEAQMEVKEKMMKSTSINSPVITFELSKEAWVGLYLLTQDKKSTKSEILVTDEDLKKATDPYIPVGYKGKITTMGKAIFNSCFPKDFPFQEKQSTKDLVNKIISKLLKTYGDEITRESVYKLSQEAFKWATIMSPSLIIDNLELPPEILKLKDKLEKSTPEEAVIITDQAQELIKKFLKDTSFIHLVESGAVKGWGQVLQIFFAKGIVADTEGNILEPIKSSISEGLTNTEFFNMSYGARKGIADRVLNTADTGYLSRKLAFFLNSVEADKYLRDCGTKRTLNLKLDSKLISRLTGRFVLENEKPILFEDTDFKAGDIIKLRSPIYCISKKICLVCYGKLLQIHKSPYIGIIAAQSLGEIGTQLIMRTFHTGGAVDIIKKDLLNDILNNDPLVELTR